MAYTDNALRLDDNIGYNHFDPDDMRSRIHHFPEQCVDAWNQGAAFDIPVNYGNVKNIVIAGMGGSAIGGELISDLLSSENVIPVDICRNYKLPSYVNANSLVICSSYSGNTEETISACYDAINKKAKIIVISSGGKLGLIAEDLGLPYFQVKYLGEPRTTVGYNFLTPLAILNKLELYLCGDGDIEEAVDNLLLLNQKLIPDVPICNNPAKELAINIEGKIVIVYGAGILSGVARRWKAQLNENAKAWAFMEILPEADHNAVSGINWPKKIRKNIAVVMLQSIDLHYRIKLRYKYTSDIFAKFGISQFRIDGVGQGKPAQILSSVMFGDYTSYYLAILNRENPSRVDSIEYIKDNMGNMF